MYDRRNFIQNLSVTAVAVSSTAVLGKDVTTEKPRIIPMKPTPGNAYQYARELSSPCPEFEDLIAQNGYWSYLYARDILKAPFPAGEPVISQDAEYSYWYAKEVLKGPFPLGEAAIAQSPVYSYDYARKVLGGPFPAGENAMRKSVDIFCSYTEHFGLQLSPVLR